MRLGIRQKLFLAVGVIAAMAVVSSLISFGFFGQVRGALTMVTGQSIPAVSSALTLSAQSADLAAAAPALAYASTDAEQIGRASCRERASMSLGAATGTTTGQPVERRRLDGAA